MIENELQSKEFYFDNFSNLIKDLKLDVTSRTDIDSFYNDINKFDDLSFQDIITYMLYCFQVIEITQKWKLKKSINYSFFIKNMENIYNEIFCVNNSTFNNKIVASTSFGNIIEKTINYNVESELESILFNYLKCISIKRNYLPSNDLTLLRGNLYCQIYITLKENCDINELCNQYFSKVGKVFEYEKFVNNAKILFNKSLSKLDLSYLELNNFLSFKTYNNLMVEKDELKKIMVILIEKFANEFFDKKVFIYLIKNIVNNILITKKIDCELEFVFNDKDDEENMISLNYNEIDCNCNNNLKNVKKILCKINKIYYSISNNKDEYIELLKIKDKLIFNKTDQNDSCINYNNMIEFISLLEFNKYLESINKNVYDKSFVDIISEVKEKNSKLDKLQNSKNQFLINTELLNIKYTDSELKDLVVKYPILSLEYTDNGVYKDIATVIKEKVLLVSQLKDKNDDEKNELNKKIKTYDMIINYRNSDLYSILNDYYSLLLIDSVDSNLIKEKEIVLKSVLPNLLKQKLIFSDNILKEKKDEIYTEYINPCIKKISQNRVNNKSFDCTKDFLNSEKSNSDNYSGICKLQEILGILSHE